MRPPSASAPPACCRSTSSATRPRCPSSETLAAERGLGLLEDACEALGARDSEGRQVGSRGNLATFAFYANKQLTTGEGGMMPCPTPRRAAQLRSERNQGRAPDMGWVDHDRLGFNYRLTDVQAALGVAQLERLDEMLAERAERRRCYTERLAALDYGAPAGEGDPAGLVLPCADRGDERRSWFVYAVRLPAGADRDAVRRRPRPARDRGEGLHAVHPPDAHYRERFGYREGQFPVAEDASARLLALPFFPSITEQQIDRVCEALAEALRGDWT